jgi:hypothetical protein
MNSQLGYETSLSQGRTDTPPNGDKIGEWLHRPGVAESTTSENDPHRHRSAETCSGAELVPQGNDLVRWQTKSKNNSKPTRHLA